MTQFGREKIIIDNAEINESNIAEIISKALMIHLQNASSIDYLYDYFKGKQPILERPKEIRPEINNIIAENRANEIVSFKTGYLIGEPIQYTSRSDNADISTAIGDLNDLMNLANKYTNDVSLVEWMYIAGLGYRYINSSRSSIASQVLPNLLNRERVDIEDEAPFKVATLDPRNTFVARYPSVDEPIVLAVRYITKPNGTIVYSAYTRDRWYELVDNASSMTLTNSGVNELGYIPIIEYPLNNARLGIFEIVLTILDAINNVQSNRVDGVEQFIQSLCVLTNADISEDAAQVLRSAGLIKLTSTADMKASIDILSQELNQDQTQTLVNYMYQTILNIVGMPNRNGGSSTSDTGAAVIVRDGWSTAEARAKADEAMFKNSENTFLRIALRIMRDTVGTPLKLRDIDIKFTRRNYDNLQSKAQTLTTMLGSDKIHPLLAFEHSGMFSDPQSAYILSKSYYDEVKQEMKEWELGGAVNDESGATGDTEVSGT